jgi:RNA polymerase sigma-70 factor, ECF subfamily
VVKAFLAAARGGDFGALMALLDPDVMLRGDATVVRMGAAAQARGADVVAARFSGGARVLRLALIDGLPGLVWFQGGQLRVAFGFTVAGGKITEVDMIADQDTLDQLDVVPLRQDGRPARATRGSPR